MDFALNEEQSRWQNEARHFAKEVLGSKKGALFKPVSASLLLVLREARLL